MVKQTIANLPVVKDEEGQVLDLDARREEYFGLRFNEAEIVMVDSIGNAMRRNRSDTIRVLILEKYLELQTENGVSQ